MIAGFLRSAPKEQAAAKEWNFGCSVNFWQSLNDRSSDDPEQYLAQVDLIF